MVTIFLSLCGVYALVTGKLHSFIAGGKRYSVACIGARMIGGLLALAFPLALLLRLALPAVMGDAALMFGAAVELGVSLLVLAAAFTAGRSMRRAAVSA